MTVGEMAGALGAAARRLAARPIAVARVTRDAAAELLKVGAGLSEVEPAKGDKRFADPAFTDNPLYRRWMQGHLVLGNALHRLVDAAGVQGVSGARAHFAATLIEGALAPTNTLVGNPAAIKRAFETGGGSLWRGARKLAADLRHNGGMPSQVDLRPFRVGENLAATPGSVVYRDALCEVLQYRPTTPQVRQRPVLLIPPQINKYYVMDMAPRRSFTEHAVRAGLPFFTVSWRNPTADQREEGLDAYVRSGKAALEVACEISGSDDCNLLGVCAGGITATALAGHLAAAGDRRVRSLTLAVTVLDWEQPSSMGMFITRRTIGSVVRHSQKRGYLDGRELSRTFSWLRPNDLVWNYWANNYLMGNDPPAFDLLYWNADTTRMPAALHRDFLQLFGGSGGFTRPGALRVLGTPVDLRKVDCDSYVLAGSTDHITPWHACYVNTRLLGGRKRFVLSNGGHIQALVNPPGNPKTTFQVGPDVPEDPEAWRAKASEQRGSWWEDWTTWVSERSEELRPAPPALGSERYPVLEPAPGGYVHQR